VHDLALADLRASGQLHHLRTRLQAGEGESAGDFGGGDKHPAGGIAQHHGRLRQRRTDGGRAGERD
jgi:hypothetical protein